MSYRLIDANAIASQRPEVNDMPCIYADLPSGLDGGHYDMRESDELQRENEKLRGLVRDYERCTMHAGCSRCEYDGKMSVHCPFSPCFPDTDELYELGVEVSDA